MNKTKIDWAEYTWNPITGCYKNCSYCFARPQSKRFAGDVRMNIIDNPSAKWCVWDDKPIYTLDKAVKGNDGRSIASPFGFAPTFHRYRMKYLEEKKHGSNIFICSMSDMFGEWVPEEWIIEILEETKKHPRHNYMFLTKNPDRYMELAEKGILSEDDNYWYGTTITTSDDLYFFSEKHNCFLSVEPILGPMGTQENAQLDNIKWVIVGAETGRQKGKTVPEKEWVDYIANECEKAGVPIFMKSSLETLMGDEFKQEFPTKLQEERPLAEKLQKKMIAECLFCKDAFKKSLMYSITVRQSTGLNKTIGFACKECLKKFCDERNIDYEVSI